VWVNFRRDGQSFLLEATCKVKDNMVRPLPDAASRYRPELGVDRNRKTFAFAGAILTMREREFEA
jgi:hypothetical protein